MKKTVLIASIMAMGLAAAQGQTILMDYDDLNPTNGVHDVAVLDGDFQNIIGVIAGNPTESSRFNQMPNWTNLRGISNPQTEIASATNLASGVGGPRNAFVTGDKNIHAQSIGYTIQEGDTFNCSFMWRTGTGSEADDVIVMTLFYTDDDTLKTNNATIVHTFTAPNAAALNTWITQSFTTPVVDAGAVGKTLMLSFTSTGSGINPPGVEFARLDNLYLESASDAEPPPPPEIGDLDIAQAGTDVVVSWNATNSATYVLQSKADLSFGGWSNLVENIVGVDGTLAVTNSTADAKAFYRVIIE